MINRLETKYLIACAGALTPIVLSLIAFDTNSLLANAAAPVVVGYTVQKIGLCIAACIIVWLSPDAKAPTTIYQLGLAAPALLGGIVNAAYHAQLPKTAMFEIPSIVGVALAAPQSASTTTQDGQIRIRDCKRELTTSQQFLKGLIGALPSDRWFVVFSSNEQIDSARGDVQDIAQKYGGRFQASICGSADASDRYRVVLGNNLTYDAAAKLKEEAIAAGFSKKIWLWSPVN